jgi:hypothetical protein
MNLGESDSTCLDRNDSHDAREGKRETGGSHMERAREGA